MRPWPILLSLLSALLSPSAARAQETIDAAKITCNQFMFGRIADSRTISIWLIGYNSGMRNNSVIDTAAVQKQAQDLVQYCMAHSEASVMDAAKSVFNVNK
jgi:HdeA/HdeB family